MKSLKFKVFSGGTIELALDECEKCQGKPCIEACNSPNMGAVLELREGLPALKRKEEEVAKGACTECLSCEFACRLKGRGGLKATLPIFGLDQALSIH